MLLTHAATGLIVKLVVCLAPHVRVLLAFAFALVFVEIVRFRTVVWFTDTLA